MCSGCVVLCPTLKQTIWRWDFIACWGSWTAGAKRSFHPFAANKSKSIIHNDNHLDEFYTKRSKVPPFQKSYLLFLLFFFLYLLAYCLCGLLCVKRYVYRWYMQCMRGIHNVTSTTQQPIKGCCIKHSPQSNHLRFFVHPFWIAHSIVAGTLFKPSLSRPARQNTSRGKCGRETLDCRQSILYIWFVGVHMRSCGYAK